MANKNNKYKVYRKYTTEDNGITWVETDEYRIVLVEENSKDCITETPTNTRWVETTGYICASKNKYAKEIKQISTDGGKTWTDTSEYRQGKLIEENSKDCGYTEVQYRWVVVNDPTKYVCVGTEKHKMEIRQLSNDGGITWANVTPEETRASDEIIERYSFDCGATIQYKWVDTGFECGSNLSSDATIVDEAPGELTKETVYRWVQDEDEESYICYGKDKYYKLIKQSSTDGGNTWTTVQPIESQRGSIKESSSNDCMKNPQYRWKKLTIEEGYICDNYSTYYKEKEEVSYGDDIWEETGASRKGELYAKNSSECKYNPGKSGANAILLSGSAGARILETTQSNMDGGIESVYVDGYNCENKYTTGRTSSKKIEYYYGWFLPEDFPTDEKKHYVKINYKPGIVSCDFNFNGGLCWNYIEIGEGVTSLTGYIGSNIDNLTLILPTTLTTINTLHSFLKLVIKNPNELVLVNSGVPYSDVYHSILYVPDNLLKDYIRLRDSYNKQQIIKSLREYNNGNS